MTPDPAAPTGGLVWMRSPTGAVKQVRDRKVRHLTPSGWAALTAAEAAAHESALATAKTTRRRTSPPTGPDPADLSDVAPVKPAPKPRRQPAPDSPAPEES